MSGLELLQKIPLELAAKVGAGVVCLVVVRGWWWLMRRKAKPKKVKPPKPSEYGLSNAAKLAAKPSAGLAEFTSIIRDSERWDALRHIDHAKIRADIEKAAPDLISGRIASDFIFEKYHQPSDPIPLGPLETLKPDKALEEALWDPNYTAEEFDQLAFDASQAGDQEKMDELKKAREAGRVEGKAGLIDESSINPSEPTFWLTTPLDPSYTPHKSIVRVDEWHNRMVREANQTQAQAHAQMALAAEGRRTMASYREDAAKSVQLMDAIKSAPHGAVMPFRHSNVVGLTEFLKATGPGSITSSPP